MNPPPDPAPCRRDARRAVVALALVVGLGATRPAGAEPAPPTDPTTAPATRPATPAEPGEDEAADEAAMRGFDQPPFRRPDRRTGDPPGDDRHGGDRPGGDRPGGDRPADRGGPGESGGADEAPGPPPSAEELAGAEAFFADHAPHRYAFYRRMLERRGPDSPLVQAARRRMVDGHRRMERVGRDSPRLYAFLVDQVALNDAVAQAARDARADPGDAARRDALRDVVRRRLDAILDARQSRLDRLTSDLDRERQALADDRARADEIVDEHVARLAEGGEE